MQFFSYARIKRLFDILYASSGLLFCALPLSCIAIAVKASSKGPIIFRQTRIGCNGLPFVCYKIRTMRTDAPQCPSAQLKDRQDLFTPVGPFLRSHSLDELPQLMNVLRGEMSLIGPRPLIPEERELHRIRTQNGVYALKPGISGLSQIIGRDSLSDKRKAKLDAVYRQNASFWLDFIILARTFPCLRHGIPKKHFHTNPRRIKS